MKSFSQSLSGWLAAVAAVGVVTLAVAPQVQAAEDDSEDIDASAHYSEANRLASAGAITRSIPHYEKVIEADPGKYPRAYYNLGEVFRAKDECKKAVLLYRAYRANQPEGDKAASAKSGIYQCSQTSGFGALKVEVSPEETGRLKVEGYDVGPVARVDGLELLPGEYSVEVFDDEYEAESDSASIEEGDTERLEFDLIKKLFFGEVLVEVDQKAATIDIEPRELDSPKADEKELDLESPMEEPEKLPAGKYFLEVNKSGYDRWIRNIEVTRDNQTTVDVEMIEALPEAIRER